MKFSSGFLTFLFFIGYFGTLITACIVSGTAWPLLIMLFVTPTVEYKHDKDDKDNG